MPRALSVTVRRRLGLPFAFIFLVTSVCTSVAHAEEPVALGPIADAEEPLARPVAEVASTQPTVLGAVRAADYGSSRYEFYGWQNMLVEGAGVTVVFAAGLAGVGSNGNEELPLIALAGAASYVAGGLIVHLVHERPAKAVGSLGFTIGLPLTGLAVGGGIAEALCPTASLSDPRRDACVEEHLAWGAVAGVLVAPLFDGLTLGWKKRGSRYARVSPSPTVVPAIVPSPSGLGLGIVGTM